MFRTRNLYSSGRVRPKFSLEDLEVRRLLTAALPPLPAIVAPASNPTLPSNFDVFDPQGATGSAGAGAPAIAQWTQSGNPGDTLAVSLTHPTALPASDDSSDTQFYTYGQTTASNGALVSDTIEQLGSGIASVDLNSGNTPNSMYFLWAENADGFSTAVAVNKTDAWWIGPNSATAGSTVSVYGQNLTFSPTDGESWVYITQAGSNTGQWATVSSANPYQVSFTVPTGLSPGNYQVWVHNGHGGEYGWSSPMTLAVVAPAAVSGTVFNVLNYGAIGNGVTDDTAAFQAAMNAAYNDPGSVVYVPAGNYIITKLNMAQDTTLEGAGVGSTDILESTTSNAASLAGMLWLQTNTQIQNLTLNDNNTALKEVVEGRFLTNIRFSNVTFDGDAALDTDIHGDNLVFFDNCNFIGSGNFLGTASQLFYNDDNFYATDDAGEMLYSWGGSDISITNCTCQDFNDSNPNSGAGWGAGRFFVGSDIWGSQTNTYIGNNTTIAMGVRPTYSNQNSGEQLLWESQNLVSGGTYVGSTAATVTYTGLPSTIGPGYVALIVAGDGVGEYAPISSYNAATGVITLATPWTATPDSTSVVRVGEIFDNIAVYDNNLQGKGITNTASTGVQFWGGAINCVVDDNTISDTRYGIDDAGLDGSGNVLPDYFNVIQNNTINDALVGVLVWNDGTSDEIGNVGAAIRFNQINLPSANSIAFYLRDVDTQGSPFYLIIEGNTVTAAAIGVDILDFGTAPTYLTLSNNSFALGAAPAAGSIGLDVTQPLVLTQSGDSFTGYAQTDGGTMTAAAMSPVAAPSQILSTTALDGTTSTGTTPPTTTTTTSGTTKHRTRNSSSTTSAAATFAAVTNNPTTLQFSSAKIGTDATFLAA